MLIARLLALISSFPGFNSLYAWIEVEGAPLQVYGIKEDGKKVVAYVEAKDGKQFEVHYLDLRSTCPTSHVVRLYVDGSCVNGMVVKREHSKFQDPPDGSSRKIVFEGSEDTRTAIRPFRFSKLQLTDDDGRACSDEQVVKNIGTVQLKYSRVDNVRSTDAFTAHAARVPTIHEKTKKAQLSHQVGFGDPVDIPAGARFAFDWIDREDDPLTMLEFRYRSRDLLQLKGYIEVSPPPEAPSPPPRRGTSERSLPPVIQPLAARRRASSSATPAAESSSKAARLAKLKREHAELEREKRLAQLREEIAALEAEREEEEVDVQAGAKRVKREGEGAPRVKVEEGGLMEGKGKGRAQGRMETVVLSDWE
ncbi:hypothetical protein JCM10450v2_002112 [Rhodotorula kratochvilovae]